MDYIFIMILSWFCVECPLSKCWFSRRQKTSRRQRITTPLLRSRSFSIGSTRIQTSYHFPLSRLLCEFLLLLCFLVHWNILKWITRFNSCIWEMENMIQYMNKNMIQWKNDIKTWYNCNCVLSCDPNTRTGMHLIGLSVTYCFSFRQGSVYTSWEICWTYLHNEIICGSSVFLFLNEGKSCVCVCVCRVWVNLSELLNCLQCFLNLSEAENDLHKRKKCFVSIFSRLFVICFFTEQFLCISIAWHLHISANI